MLGASLFIFRNAMYADIKEHLCPPSKMLHYIDHHFPTVWKGGVSSSNDLYEHQIRTMKKERTREWKLRIAATPAALLTVTMSVSTTWYLASFPAIL